MSQHDYDLANANGASFRSDANNALAAIVSLNSGASEPSTMFAYMLWADTTSGSIKQRNAANNAWVTVGTMATTNWGFATIAGTQTISGATGFTALQDVTFTSTSRRIKGDFDNATIASRLSFQSANSNQQTIVQSLPSGSSSAAGYLAINNSTPTNAGTASLTVDSTAAYLTSGRTGSGTYLPLHFLTSGTVWARIDISGNLLYNCASTFGSGYIQIAHDGASKNGINLHDTSTGATSRVTTAFYRNTSLVGSITTTDVATAYNTSSDSRLKTEIVNAPYEPTWIDNVVIREYEFRSSPGVKVIGVIAQELATVEPSAVTPGDGDENKEQGDEGFIPAGVDYSKLVPKLILEIQSLRSRVDELESA